MKKKLDVMFFGAHPDDIEIFVGGTIQILKKMGYAVGMGVLTNGEMGTYGSAEERKEETRMASKILKVDVLEFLGIPDSEVKNTRENQLRVVEVIRKHQPEIVFTMKGGGRNPDHINAKDLVRDSVFLAGLSKILPDVSPYRPSKTIYYPESSFVGKPDFVVDITETFETKLEAIMAHKSQVMKEGDDDSQSKTVIKSNLFWKMVRRRAHYCGSLIGRKYGEPFFTDGVVMLNDVVSSFKMGRLR